MKPRTRAERAPATDPRRLAALREWLDQRLAEIDAALAQEENMANQITATNVGSARPVRRKVDGCYRDLYVAGVLDAKKVLRVALQNAASVAALMLTTDCIIAGYDVAAPEPPFDDA
ncbi:MAG: hypothetical protein WD775_00845 [Burkholderiales bacterium]